MIRRLSNKLIQIEREPWLAPGLWALCSVRKATRCALTSAKIRVGDKCWRPLTNCNRRAQRIKDAELVKRFALDTAPDTR